MTAPRVSRRGLIGGGVALAGVAGVAGGYAAGLAGDDPAASRATSYAFRGERQAVCERRGGEAVACQRAGEKRCVQLFVALRTERLQHAGSRKKRGQELNLDGGRLARLVPQHRVHPADDLEDLEQRVRAEALADAVQRGFQP